jgi:hypothetical protein
MFEVKKRMLRNERKLLLYIYFTEFHMMNHSYNTMKALPNTSIL